MTEEPMFNAIKLAVPDNRLLMLLQFIRDMEREFCLLHSRGCPMSYSLFNELHDAIKTGKTGVTKEIVAIQIPKMILDAKRASRIGEAILHVFAVMDSALEVEVKE